MSTWRIIVATGLRHACILLAVLATLAFGGDIHVHQVVADAQDTCRFEPDHAHADPSPADAAGEDEGSACDHCDCPLSTSTLPGSWASLAQGTSYSARLRPHNDPALRGLNHQPDPPPVLG